MLPRNKKQKSFIDSKLRYNNCIMRVIKKLDKNLFEASSLALGVFDGVHIGHRSVITDAIQKAKELSITSAIVTFSCHPKSVITGIMPGMITPLEDKLELFSELGVDATVIIDFNEEFAKMTAEEYLKNILTGCLNVKSLSVGYNHQFGSDRKGTGDFLKQYCAEHNIQLDIIPPVKIDNHTVSSSVIRGFIASGDVLSANEFLGRPFKIKGKVVEGQHLGRKLGFPTANLQVNEDLILPLRGVYSGTVTIEEKVYKAVINVGRRPTIGDLQTDLVEAHILNFDRDIYGQVIEVAFLERIRDEKKFDSLDDLKKQINQDCEIVNMF